MKYCNKCFYPANHPLGITFDKNGVCSGCRIHEEKFYLDWKGRLGKLLKITASYKKTAKYYDCIVPVSGARDSYFIVHIVKNILGMNPLLVHYNKHYNTHRGIRNLSYLKTLFDCDMITNTIKPETVKKITRRTMELMGSMYWHCLAGHTVFPVQIAVRMKIPLIIWGAHQGCDQVGMFSHTDEVEMTRKYRKDHDLMGYEAEDLMGKNGELQEQDLVGYLYPHDKEISKVGVRGIYLGNYIPWDTKKQHELMIKMYSYESSSQARTFDTYNDVDCFHYSGIHDYIKFAKWGYGKVTDHACRELRWNRLSRESGARIIHEYTNKIVPQDIDILLHWLEMPKTNFLEAIDKKRDTRIWDRKGDKWELSDSVWKHVSKEKTARSSEQECEFMLSDNKMPSMEEDKYWLFARGFVDDWTVDRILKTRTENNK